MIKLQNLISISIPYLKVLALLCLSISLYSCSYSSACYNNLQGVFSFENGSFSQALINYRKASEDSISYSEYISYNISRVFTDMGEIHSATGILKNLSGSDDEKLQYRINYLKAVIAFNEGRYEDSILFYKNSIKIDNSDIKLLKGIELAFKQLENKKSRSENIKNNSDSLETDNSSGVAQSEFQSIGGNKNTADLFNLLFTEEVKLCPGNRNMDQGNMPDW